MQAPTLFAASSLLALWPAASFRMVKVQQDELEAIAKEEQENACIQSPTCQKLVTGGLCPIGECPGGMQCGYQCGVQPPYGPGSCQCDCTCFGFHSTPGSWAAPTRIELGKTSALLPDMNSEIQILAKVGEAPVAPVPVAPVPAPVPVAPVPVAPVPVAPVPVAPVGGAPAPPVPVAPVGGGPSGECGEEFPTCAKLIGGGNCPAGGQCLGGRSCMYFCGYATRTSCKCDCQCYEQFGDTVARQTSAEIDHIDADIRVSSGTSSGALPAPVPVVPVPAHRPWWFR